LPRSKAGAPSELEAAAKDWEGYKKYASTLEGRNFLFRGQNNPWRLRTAFHRNGRADLTRFLNEDIQILHRHLSARTKHLFNLNNAAENGAFFNLLQHHGYPTPLLDWTYSPYVAAFFAYRGISNKMAAKAAPSAKVRIHVFDQSRWKIDWNQVLMLLTTAPHLSFLEFMAIENERLIPQHSASTVTNLDDIETYIRSKETQEKTYLTAIDLPVRERRKVVHELSYMGITAGSLFPGLDGACEELRERHFDI
jgi:FRG domain